MKGKENFDKNISFETTQHEKQCENSFIQAKMFHLIVNSFFEVYFEDQKRFGQNIQKDRDDEKYKQRSFGFPLFLFRPNDRFQTLTMGWEKQSVGGMSTKENERERERESDIVKQRER